MEVSIVIGANGFLGSNLVNKLIENNQKVVAVYNTNFDSIHKKATVVSIKEIFTSSIKADYVYFLSGNYACSHQDLVQINEELILCCKAFPKAKFIYVSSTNVYGSNSEIISENSAFKSPGIYGISKLAGEFIVSSMENFSIIRMTYIYGLGISNNSFIPQMISKAKEQKIILFGNGERKQDYIYIDDAVDLCFACSKNKKNAILIGATGVSISNLQVCEAIRQHIPCEIAFTGTETGQSFYFTVDKAKNELHWEPKVPFSEGIKKMLS